MYAQLQITALEIEKLGLEQAPVGVAVSVLKAHAGMAGNAASTQPFSTKEARPSLTAPPTFLRQISFPSWLKRDTRLTAG